MIDKVKATIEKYGMLKGGERVIVALSGGSDSMTLLNVLYELREEYNLTLEAAHVNHCLRGNDADADEQFARRECEKKGIVIHVLRADVRGEAEKSGETLEEAGRRIRYGFFESLGEDAVTATAHNLNDRIETFMFNFSRGTALKGLCSIPPVRNRIIRPLIDCSKQEILEYCSDNSIGYVTDKTNADVKYSRNRIRHNVLPELKELNPGFEMCAGRCMDSLNEDEEFLHSLAEKATDEAYCQNGYLIERLYRESGPVRKRAIRIIAENSLDIKPDSRTLETIDGLIREYAENGKGSNAEISGGNTVRTRAGMLEFPKVSETQAAEQVGLKLGSNSFGNYCVVAELVDADTVCLQNISKDLSLFYADCGIIRENTVIRSRNPEDRISYSKGNFSKALRKIQNEKAIPPEERDLIPVIADEKGLLIAAYCGIDSRAVVKPGQTKAVRIQIYKKTDI